MPILAVTKERRAGETRVAVTPETAKKFVAGVFAAVLIVRSEVESSSPPPGLPATPSSPGSFLTKSGVRSGVFEGGLVPMTESSKL